MRTTNVLQIILFSIMFLPAVSAANNTGAIVGTVVDSLNNLVVNAEVQVYCGSLVFSKTTDKFGTFVLTKLPIGFCTAYARFSDSVGFTNVAIVSNDTKTAQIKLDKTIVDVRQKDKMYWSIGMLVLLILIGVIIFFAKDALKKMWQENKKTNLHKQKNTKKIILNTKIKTLLNALSDKEQEIIKYLVIQKGESAQSKIRYQTGIPKASLSRHIKNLEAKKIIHVQRIGKLSKIKLSKEYSDGI